MVSLPLPVSGGNARRCACNWSSTGSRPRPRSTSTVGRCCTSSSMWQAHAIDVGDELQSDNELVIVCRALRPLLRRRRRPNARWRTRVVNDGNLRWHRTMVFGRSPGFAAAPAAVGPWRPVRLSPAPALSDIAIRSRVDNHDGIVHVNAHLTGPEDPAATISIGSVSAPLQPVGDGTLQRRAARRGRAALVAAHPRRTDAVRARDLGRRRDGRDSPDRLPDAAIPGRHPLRRTRAERQRGSGVFARGGLDPGGPDLDGRPATRICAICWSASATRA